MSRRYFVAISSALLFAASSLAACGNDSDPNAPDAPNQATADHDAPNVPGTPAAPRAPGAPAGTASVPDARLATDVIMRLVADREVDARKFDVRVVQGVVTLFADKDTPQNVLERAQNLAKSVEGVQNVILDGVAAVLPTTEDQQRVDALLQEAQQNAPTDAEPSADAPPADEPSPSVENTVVAMAEVATPPPAAADPTPPSNPASAQAANPTPAAGSLTSYTVKRGESLSVIASRQLGDGSRWQEVYRMNRDIIGPNPDGLREGMTIQLPPR